MRILICIFVLINDILRDVIHNTKETDISQKNNVLVAVIMTRLYKKQTTLITNEW